MATSLPLASPLGSFGRPTFLGFACGIDSELLNDERSYGSNRRQRRVNTKDRDGSERLPRIARIVQPCIRRVGLRMACEAKDFDDPIPNRLPVENLFYG